MLYCLRKLAATACMMLGSPLAIEALANDVRPVIAANLFKLFCWPANR